MGIFDFLSGKSKKDAADVFYEKDNMGTRQDTFEKALAYWTSRMRMTRKDPFALYIFNNEGDAANAMLALPCIKLSKDTKKLVCTKVLTFGIYKADDKYEAIICGEDLNHELWEQARESFKKWGGILKNELEPEKKAEPAEAAARKPGPVIFVREDRVNDQFGTTIYRVYKGPDADTAKDFLSKNPIDKKLFYIVVETPEGNYGRDINGIYKE